MKRKMRRRKLTAVQRLILALIFLHENWRTIGAAIGGGLMLIGAANLITADVALYVDYSVALKYLAKSWGLPKTTHQTVTATVGGQTYTSDFYAPQGSQITFSAKADAGYFVGIVSPNSATLTRDLAVTVTEAAEREDIEAGSRTVAKSDSSVSLKVPPKVYVVKMIANNATKFVRVEPQATLLVSVEHSFSGREYWEAELAYEAPPAPVTDPSTPPRPPVLPMPSSAAFARIFGFSDIMGSLVIEWSNEINAHAIDYDLTK